MKPNPALAAQIARITRYEALFDQACQWLRTDPASDRLRSLAAELEAYYTGPAWRQDLAADEAGLLPRDLRRGVLSQDGIDSLLAACDACRPTAVLYLHGRGGSPQEAAHYRPLFPGCEVRGLAYTGTVPWQAGQEIGEAVSALASRCGRILLVANSIGAYFALHAGIDRRIAHAWFLSPVVDMERMIRDAMRRLPITEEELRAKGTVATGWGDTLSWRYLDYVRTHPIRWTTPTDILYSQRDALVPRETVEAFAAAHGAVLTVTEEGEHWFHTAAQMRLVDDWIQGSQ